MEWIRKKTNIPHIISNPKALAGSYTLETHVTGIRAHGQITIMALDCQQFKHDSNLTIDIIIRVLTRLKVTNTLLFFYHSLLYNAGVAPYTLLADG